MPRRNLPPALKPRPEKPLDRSDVELLRASLSDVTPLGIRNKATLARHKPKPRPLARERSGASQDDLSDRMLHAREPGEPLTFTRPGVQRQAVQRLRRAGAVQDELDLHGLTVAAARPMLVAFLNACTRRGLHRVRIIHGKGLRSGTGEGVLKGMVAGWLAQRADVLAFCEAPPSGGGAGAVIVLLKRS